MPRCSPLVLLLLAAWGFPTLRGEPRVTAAEGSGPKQILLLLPFESARPASQEILAGIEKGLRESWSNRVSVFVEFIRQAPQAQDNYLERQFQWLRYKYADRQFDAILAIRPESVFLAERLQHRLWPEAPILFGMGKGEYRREFGPGPNRTGILMDLGEEDAINAALQLLPETRRVAILDGSAQSDQEVHSRILSLVRKSNPSLEIIHLSDLNLADLKKRVSQLPEKTILYLGQFSYDAEGRSFTDAELVTILNEVSNRPLFSSRTLGFGLGTVGGPMNEIQRGGEAMGTLAVNVLRGASANALPVVMVPHTSAVDWRQLQKWRIPESRLPAGTEIRFRPVTVWDQFRNAILLIGGAILLQAIVIGVLLAERRRRGKSERKARASEDLNRGILSSLNAGIAVLDQSGSVTRLSENWARLPAVCYLPFVIGTSYVDVWRSWSDAATSRRVAGAVEAVLSGQETLQSVDHHVEYGEAGYWIEIRVERLVTPAGGAVVSHFDITARRNVELDRRRMLEELHHMNRTAAVGELAGALAHELAQPLASILSNAQAGSRFANRPEPDLDEIRGALGEIADDDRRARMIIERMRTILKRQAIQAQELDLNLVVIEVSRLVRSVLQMRDVRMNLELATEKVQVRGDTVALQQVLLNLIQNAIDAVQTQPRGSRLLTVRTEFNDKTGEMVVQDNGPGISAAVRDRLFESFFTTKQEGLGMGLSICRSIVEGFGGKIRAENGASGGALFRVSLPLSLPAATELTKAIAAGL